MMIERQITVWPLFAVVASREFFSLNQHYWTRVDPDHKRAFQMNLSFWDANKRSYIVSVELGAQHSTSLQRCLLLKRFSSLFCISNTLHHTAVINNSEQWQKTIISNCIYTRYYPIPPEVRPSYWTTKYDQHCQNELSHSQLVIHFLPVVVTNWTPGIPSWRQEFPADCLRISSYIVGNFHSLRELLVTRPSS